MDRLPFVGRQAELGTIHDALARGAAGQGTILLIEGVAGVGKSVLLDELMRSKSEILGIEEAVFATGHCYPETGQQNAYQPFVEILESLDHGAEAGQRRLMGVAKIIKDTAPDWLALVPLAGPVIAAGVKTATMAGELLIQGRASKSRSEGLVGQYLATVDKLLRGKELLVLVIEDVHWIDRASAELLLRLADRTVTGRLVILLTCRPGDSDSDTPLGHLRLELGARDRLELLVLGGLTQPQITTYLQQRFSTTFGREFPSWLIHLCQGHPFFVSQYLSLLEEERIIVRADGGFSLDGSVEHLDGRWEVTGRLREMPTSSSIEALLDRRIHSLVDEEREMLEIGSVQGQYFDSLVIVELTDRKEHAVLAQLRRVSERHHIISLITGQDWEQGRSEAYAFEHMLMHQAFYRKLSPYERLRYHQEVGLVLQKVVAKYETPPRKLLIDVAYHAKNGGDNATAAQFYLQAAQATHADGAAVEASHLASDAVVALRALPVDAADRDRMLAEAALLVLICAVYGAGDRSAITGLLELAAEGEAAATRSGHPSVVAEIVAITGHLHIRSGNVPKAMAVMRRALALARATEDPLTEFFATTQLASQLAKENLTESVAVRHEALEFFQQHVSLEGLSPAQKDLILGQHSSLLVLIGLGEFDSGNFETAIDWLERGLTELRNTHKMDELPAALNYLAQVHTCVGLYDDAQHYLEEALRPPEGAEGSIRDAWSGYNLGLLAKVHLEAGRVGSAATVIAGAVEISESFGHMDLLTLVWNYQGEILMDPRNAGMNLTDAERVLRNNLDVSDAAGLTRAATQAASLLGQVLLRLGRPEEAETYSGRAVSDISRQGDMPAVRTEEILYNHWLVLDAVGKSDQALAYLTNAWNVVQSKLERMHDPAHRAAFTEQVPLNVAITSAYRARQADEKYIGEGVAGQ